MSLALRRPGTPQAAAPAPPAAAPAALPASATDSASVPAAAPAAAPAPAYVGLVTRTIAFSVDAALVNVVALAVTGIAGLVPSVISLPQQVRAALAAVGGAAYLLWVAGYFVTFWTTTGQTPGDRLLRIRVVPSAHHARDAASGS